MSRSLKDLHPVVATMAWALLEKASDEGVPLLITQTLRTFDEQATLYAKGRTTPGPKVTNAKPGMSYHNYGLAFDIVVLGTRHEAIWDTKVDVNADQIPDYFQVGSWGEALGLEWGGRWTFVDLPHFQYTFGLTIHDLFNGTRPPARL